MAGILLFPLLSCNQRFYRINNVYSIVGVNNNVCKKLTGKVVLYAIFVDTRQARPWTDYDLSSTLDSIRKSISWIEKKASEQQIPLSIELAYHVNKGKIPVDQNLFGESLSDMLFRRGIETTNLWANAVARKVAAAFPPDTSPRIQTKNVISSRERLIARLRDRYKTDNVVLMYFVNNYYRDEVSVAIHSASNTETEYAIVSFKEPAVIAHEFLHVFGATDLYMSHFSRKRKAVKNRVEIMKTYPNEVMAFAHRPLEKLDISPLSHYLIGWKDTLRESDRKLLVGKKIKVVKN